jgi:outer membrane protein
MRYLNVVIGVSNILVLAALFYWYLSPANTIVYIDTYKVYDGFTLKKQMQQNLENTLQKEQGYVDSLSLQLKAAKLQYEKKPNETMKKVILFIEEKVVAEEKQVKERYEELADKFDGQIWTQLNQYITDYGKDNDVEMILGASGNGSIMYAKPHCDITEDVIKYVNKRYEGL